MAVTSRNALKKEEQILIERIHILQEQEKSYEDLSGAITKKQEELCKLNNDFSQREEELLQRQKEFNELGIKVKEKRSEVRREEKQIRALRRDYHQESEDYIKHKTVYNNHLTRRQNTLKDLEGRIEAKKEEYLKEEKAFNEFIENIKKDKGDAYEKFIDNEHVIQEQEDTIFRLKEEIKDLAFEKAEIDKEYQDSLEKYIVNL